MEVPRFQRDLGRDGAHATVTLPAARPMLFFLWENPYGHTYLHNFFFPVAVQWKLSLAHIFEMSWLRHQVNTILERWLRPRLARAARPCPWPIRVPDLATRCATRLLSIFVLFFWNDIPPSHVLEGGIWRETICWGTFWFWRKHNFRVLKKEGEQDGGKVVQVFWRDFLSTTWSGWKFLQSPFLILWPVIRNPNHKHIDCQHFFPVTQATQVLAGMAGTPTDECAYVASTVTDLPYFSSKVGWGIKNGHGNTTDFKWSRWLSNAKTSSVPISTFWSW